MDLRAGSAVVREIHSHLTAEITWYPVDITAPDRLITGAAPNVWGNWVLLGGPYATDSDIHFYLVEDSENAGTFEVEWARTLTYIKLSASRFQVPIGNKMLGPITIDGQHLPAGQTVYGRLKGTPADTRWVDFFWGIHHLP